MTSYHDSRDSVFSPGYTGTGFIFKDPNSEELLSCLRRTLILYLENNTEMRRIKMNAMKVRFNWSDSCAQYETLYKSALQKPKW